MLPNKVKITKNINKIIIDLKYKILFNNINNYSYLFK